MTVYTEKTTERNGAGSDPVEVLCVTRTKGRTASMVNLTREEAAELIKLLTAYLAKG